jgi:hypothetical protein
LKTNLVYKIESTTKQQGQDIKMTSKPLDYKETDFGVKMAFKVDLGAMMMVSKIVTTNPVVDEKIFTGN